VSNILDDQNALTALDSIGALGALWDLPEQCTRAWALADGVTFPDTGPLSNVVVTGLGGSAIGGDLLRVWAAGRLAVPVLVNRDYRLPAFVGEDSLVFCVSYSGNTEETLSAYAGAREKGARVVALTSGGRLKEMAASDGVPVITVPGGISPRSATGYLFLPMLKVLHRLGLVDDPGAEVAELVTHLAGVREEIGPAVPEETNPAKQLARRLVGKLPVIWGTAGTTEVVALRFKGQINENAKAPAYWSILPELNHNEINGFTGPGEALKLLSVVLLRDAGDHPRVGLRMDITRRIIAEQVDVTELTARGEGRLARTYDLIYRGDYTSVYLAALYGIDPGPVPVIERLKKELAKL